MLAPEEKISAQKADEIIERLENSLRDQISLKKDVKTGQISDLFDRHILARIEQFFAHSNTGYYSLTAAEFRLIISEYIPSTLVEHIYRAIDVNDVGHIKYSEFTNYLIASEAGSSFSARTFISRLIPLDVQEFNGLINHRDAIDCLIFARRPCPMLITGGRDGQLSMWDPDSLEVIATIDHRDKNAIYREELNKTMNTFMKSQTARNAETHNSRVPTKMAITSLACIFNWGLLCVGSADGCVTVYEMASQDVCGRVTDFQNIPTAIECFQRKQPIAWDSADNTAKNRVGNDEISSYIAIGDSVGFVRIIHLHPEFGNSAEVGSKKKNQTLFAQSIQPENMTHFAVHKDWITKLQYISEANALLSSSVDCTIAFIDVNRGEVTKVFKAHTDSVIGIRSFSWSAFSKYVISGAERELLLWDPYTLEVMSRIDNLRAPLADLEVSDAHNKIFAALTNKNIMVWHNITLELLQVIVDTTVYKPVDALASMVFIPERGNLYTAGDRITSWTLERSSEGTQKNEEEDLVSALYNPLYNQVLMVKSLGTLKVYQAETGEISRQFMIRPVDPRTSKPLKPMKDPVTGILKPMITAACLDKNLSRLIVSSSDIGVQFWNIHDGSNLIQVHPQLYSTSLSHVYSTVPKHITLLLHEILEPRHEEDERKRAPPMKLLLVGTDHGHVCIYHEQQAMIEEIPSGFLRLVDNNNDEPVHSNKHHLDGSSMLSFGSNLSEMLSPQMNKHNPTIGGKGNTAALASDPVMWVKLLPSQSETSSTQWIYVGYSSGRVVAWDPASNQKMRELNPKQWGASLYAMKLKGSKNEDDKPVVEQKSSEAAPHPPAGASKFEALMQLLPSKKKAEDKAQSNEDKKEKPPTDKMIKEDQLASPESTKGGSSSLDFHRKMSINAQAKAASKQQSNLLQLPPTKPTESSPANDRMQQLKSAIMGTVVAPPSSSAAPASRAPTMIQVKEDSSDDDEADLNPDEEHNHSHSRASVLQKSGQFGAKALHQPRKDSAAITMRKHSIQAGLASDNLTPAPNAAIPPNTTVDATAVPLVQSTGVVMAALHPRPPKPIHGSILLPGSRSLTINMSRKWSAQTPHTPVNLIEGSKTEASLYMHQLPSVLDSSMSSLSLPAIQNTISATDGSVEQVPAVSHSTHPHPPLVVNKPPPVVDNKKSIRYQHGTSQESSMVSEGSQEQSHDQVSDSQSTSTRSRSHNHRHHSGKHHSGKHHSGSQVPDTSVKQEKVVVDCVTFLAETKVLIGGCSDRYLRVWDLETAEVLCSSPYIVTHTLQQPVINQKSTIPQELLPEEVLRLLSVSDSEDLLVGGYDSGMIRVWTIQSYSILTLRNMLKKHINTMAQIVQATSHHSSGAAKKLNRNLPTAVTDFGANLTLAISPLTLISEFSAHTCPILSMEYVWFDYEASLTKSGADAGHGASPRSPSKRSQKDNKDGKKDNNASTQQGRNKRRRNGDMGSDVLEGYVLSAGLDQRVFLWNLQGKCVGEFGTFGWDINSEKTWAEVNKDSKRLAMKSTVLQKKKKAISSSMGGHASMGADMAMTSMMQPKAPEESKPSKNLYSARNVTKESLTFKESPSSVFIQNFLKQNAVLSAKEMNKYVDELTRKIVNKPPVYQEVDNQLHNIMGRYPMSNVKLATKKANSSTFAAALL